MGEIAQAATFWEQAMKLNPEATNPIPLAAFYAILGRDQDAQAIVEMYRKKRGGRVPDLGIAFW